MTDAKTDEANLKRLFKARSSLKAKLTQFVNYLNVAKGYSALSIAHKIELETRIKFIETAYKDFNKLQTEIEALTEDAQREFAEREQFESVFFANIALARSMLESPSSDGLERRRSEAGSGEKKDFFRLPDITPPSFDGDYHHWLEFRDTYISLIHNNPRINDISKFHYLRASLKGNASLVIQSLEFTSSNYIIAWQLLTERYDNPKILINNHIQSLFNVDPVQKDSCKSIRNLIDTTNKNLRALCTLGQPTDHWDILIIFMMSKKLDFVTSRQWEEFKNTLSDQPSLKQFLTFLNNRAELLETLNSNKQPYKPSHIVTQTSKPKSFAVVTENKQNINQPSCPLCKQEHFLFNCSSFRELDVDSRIKHVSSFKNFCKNCLRTGHLHTSCRLTHCKYCKSKHNTLLHKDTDVKTNTETVSLSAHTHSSSLHASHNHVLLSTALVKVRDTKGVLHTARVLLDNGSTSNFVTSALCEKLGLPRFNSGSTVVGINNSVSSITKSCSFNIQSCFGSYETNIECFILPHITTSLPSTFIYKKHIPIPTGIKLADPSFNVPASIDILVGAEIFWSILGTNFINLGNHQPSLRETKLGWIVSGSIPSVSNSTRANNCHFSQTIESQLGRFWELDSVSASPVLSKDEQACEQLFQQTTRRDNDGKFIVTLPLKEPPQALGDSYFMAKNRFLSIERKLQRNEQLKNDYHQFMREYLSLGHMTLNTNITKYKKQNLQSSTSNNTSSTTSLVHSSNTTSSPAYTPTHTSIHKHQHTSKPTSTHTITSKHNKNVNNYLPHHAVMRESSTTTKLRVVFDASAATSSGKSYNDIQRVGPTVQDDLLSILLRFRQHKYVVTSDIEKMYRAINVEPSQRPLQQIIFRFDPSEPLQTYTLNTICYGTASAPYLATRCLLALAETCTNADTKRAISHGFYIDDLLLGEDSITALTNLCHNVISVLETAKFNLRKWQSNSPEILQSISEIKGDKDKTLNLNNPSPCKTLGLFWNSATDCLFFEFDLNPNYKITKRTILSAISQIFDPLGLVGPCIVVAKIILQELWKLKSDWDDDVPNDLKQSYINLINSLSFLNNVNIPRWSFNEDDTIITEIHIFTDASERAYGACCYIRTVTRTGSIRVRLLTSKNKIAPIKASTIPRLELCGAQIGSKLYKKVKKSLTKPIDKSYFYTDSSIVLGWLATSSNRLKSFVRNRVNEIQENTDSAVWHYVPSKENPADLVSRGVRADSLSSSSLWWTGPSFLHSLHIQLPNKPNTYTQTNVSLPEMSFFVDNTDNSIINLINKISNFSKLIRIVAYMNKFINCLKNKNLDSKNKKLTSAELLAAHNTIIRFSQQCLMFPEEYHILKSNQTLPSKNRLLSLTPFIDSDGIIRVGGRLQNSNYTYNVKHPILLCSKHTVTKLIFENQHITSLHASPLLLLSQIRQRYWVLGGRNLAKRVVHSCIRCVRLKAKTTQPIMSHLPSDRLSLEFPFLKIGLDNAGPVMMLNRKGRGSRLIKSYICVFICFAVKAIHLEVLTDLTKECFLSALNRFIARRGLPQTIYCDNGTTFVGAFNHMIANCMNDVHGQGIDFKFIPAYSPHFGGLWEAAVKSVKFHLVRILGQSHLVYEEMITCVAQIESILNSRPLTPMSTDPSDLTFLTPSHFLIGRSHTSVLYPDLTDTNITTLQRFQRVEKLKQHFWKRFSNEYVSLLQQKHKWKSTSGHLQVGAMVVIKDKMSPPLMWLLGRITNIVPGPDGIPRVADIQTRKGVLRRAYNNICPLPVQSAA